MLLSNTHAEHLEEFFANDWHQNSEKFHVYSSLAVAEAFLHKHLGKTFPFGNEGHQRH